MKLALLLLLSMFVAGCAHAPIAPATPGQNSATVQQGENIYDVARRLNVTVADLAAVNHLSPPYPVKIGQSLIIPAIRVYTVAKGDSLSKIAQHFDVGQSNLAQLNHLTPPYKIFPGQQLQITGGAVAGSSPAAAATVEAVAPVAPRSTVEAVPLSDSKPAPPAEQAATVSASPTALAPQPTGVAVAPEPVASSGKFAWPVRGQVISPFGPKPDGLQNDGINIAAASGTPVDSAAAGTVAYAGNELRGFGNLVLVKHSGGWVSAYAHLETIAVKKGDTVKTGQLLGTVGQTGAVDSPQLHFELRKGKEAVDPATQLR